MFLFPIKAIFPSLKSAAIKDVYLPLVASEGSRERILNNNQLRYIEQLLNTNKPIFLYENNEIYKFSIGNRKNSELLPILNTCISKTL